MIIILKSCRSGQHIQYFRSFEAKEYFVTSVGEMRVSPLIPRKEIILTQAGDMMTKVAMLQNIYTFCFMRGISDVISSNYYFQVIFTAELLS